MPELKGRIYRSSQRVFTCKLLESGEFVEATALANLLKDRELGGVVVGDEVILSGPSQNELIIESVLPRRNEVYRIVVREQRKKISASNIDILAIVSSVSKPSFKRGILERYLIRAYQWGLNPIIIFNKMDEFSGVEGEANFNLKFETERLNLIEEYGVPCFEVSAIKGASYLPRFLDKGLKDLQEFLKDKTVLMQGQSGVGKSKLISALTGEEVQLKSGEVGKIGKGTHTTTWSEMLDYNGMTFIDSPGIRSFSVEDILKEDLLSLFPDVQEVALRCRYTNCTHEKDNPHCAFYDKMNPRREELGITEEKISMLQSRLESFLEIQNEISKIPSWANNFKDKKRK